MTLENLLELLSGVEKRGNHFVALCPAHEDHSPSLSVKAGERWLLTRCYVGCTTEEICSALGIRVSDLAFDKPRFTTGSWKDEDLDTASLFVDLSGGRRLSVADRARMVQDTVKHLRSPSPASPPHGSRT